MPRLASSYLTFTAPPRLTSPSPPRQLYKTRADLRNSVGKDLAAAVTDYDSAVANLLLDGQGAASADPSELPRTYLARAALNEKLGRYVLTSHHSPFTTHLSPLTAHQARHILATITFILKLHMTNHTLVRLRVERPYLNTSPRMHVPCDSSLRSRYAAAEADLTGAEAQLENLPRVAQTNPLLYKNRANDRMRLGRWDDAATDALEAEEQFTTIGDKIRRTLSAADAALALYPSDKEGSVEKMRQVFREKGLPTTNNPDDIPLLQELSRADAELHIAYAADLFANGQKTRAKEQWESGCIRLEAYVQDGKARLEEEQKLQRNDVRKEMGQPLPPPSLGLKN